MTWRDSEATALAEGLRVLREHAQADVRLAEDGGSILMVVPLVDGVDPLATARAAFRRAADAEEASGAIWDWDDWRCVHTAIHEMDTGRTRHIVELTCMGKTRAEPSRDGIFEVGHDS